ncbi:hypothetical protein FOZ61_006930 [Perkinsus olseni]|uniref:Initiation-specific alpha-1,6-mannosyltransferase n=1 Tax=Perkinsus olseni TaxID=32597 RepID=A0A7J6LBF8_PEROL|nr:hypothetical protein FOZ61_006930 [Perkinsus olseni]
MSDDSTHTSSSSFRIPSCSILTLLSSLLLLILVTCITVSLTSVMMTIQVMTVMGIMVVPPYSTKIPTTAPDWLHYPGSYDGEKGEDYELQELRARVRVLEEEISRHQSGGQASSLGGGGGLSLPSIGKVTETRQVQFIPPLINHYHHHTVDTATRDNDSSAADPLCKGITLRIASIIPPRAVLYDEDGTPSHQKIPPIIWQTYKTSRMPDRMAQNAFNWAGMNPEYAYRFFDDNLAREYLVSSDALPVSTSDIKNALDQLPRMFQNGAGVAMADIWRLAVLYEYGGVYADVDSIIVNPLRRWVDPHATVVTSIEAGRFIAQYVMMFRPKHPVTKEALRSAVRNIINRTPSSLAKFPDTLEAYTGPAVVKGAFDTWLSAHNQQLVASDKPIVIGEDIRVFEDVGFSGNVKFKDGKYHADLKKCNQGHWLYGWYRNSADKQKKRKK